MKFAVKVHNKYLSEAVQKLAFENGYAWYNNGSQEVYHVPLENYGENTVLFFENNGITFEDVSYAEKARPDWKLFDARMEWVLIEQAMKPKEPRVIYINEYKISEGTRLNDAWHYDKGTAEAHKVLKDFIRTVKFMEVL